MFVDHIFFTWWSGGGGLNELGGYPDFYHFLYFFFTEDFEIFAKKLCFYNSIVRRCFEGCGQENLENQTEVKTLGQIYLFFCSFNAHSMLIFCYFTCYLVLFIKQRIEFRGKLLNSYKAGKNKAKNQHRMGKKKR